MKNLQQQANAQRCVKTVINDTNDTKKTLNRYKVVICPKCKVIQGTESKSRLLCTQCGKTTPFKKKGVYIIKIYGHYESPTHARLHIQRLKKEQSKQ